MTVTDQELRAIAFIVARCRPPGASRWDEAGIFANLAQRRDVSLIELTRAALNAAEDPNVHTPGVIPKPGPHWRRPDGARRQVTEPYNPGVNCSICTKPDGPQHPPDHEHITAAEQARRAAQVSADRRDQIRQAIGDAKAKPEPAPEAQPVQPDPNVTRLREAVHTSTEEA